MELLDLLLLGMSPLDSISRLGTCHLKRVGGDFRVPFCDPTEGIHKFSFGDIFCMRGGDGPHVSTRTGVSKLSMPARRLGMGGLLNPMARKRSSAC